MRLNRKNGLLIILCAALFPSCAQRYRNALFTHPSDLLTDTVKSVYVVNSDDEGAGLYKIKPNDVLSVRNLQDIRYIATSIGETQTGITTGSTNYQVETNGTVLLPVIGEVAVAGLTRKEASEKIQGIYQQKLLKDPIIELSIVNLKVTLLGEFAKQGNYLLQKETTSLIEIIGEAGGINPRADPKTLKIIRGDKQNPQIIYVNLKDVNTLSRPELNLRNNDIVYIEPQKIYDSQERVQTLSAIFQPALIVLNTALIIYTFTRR